MDAGYGKEYRRLYETHWWWRSRERMVTNVIESLQLPQRSEILDFGCGDGLFFKVLRRFGNVRGIEIDRDLVSAENPDIGMIFSDRLGSDRYDDWRFDLITALDVIEHIEDDNAAVASLVSMLKPGGRLIITVPAFMVLWDQHDVINKHFRRYSRRGLMALVPCDASIVRTKFMFQSIFPVKLVVAILNSFRNRAIAQHRVPSKGVNAALAKFCVAEFSVLGRHSLPFGTSLMAVIERKGGVA